MTLRIGVLALQGAFALHKLHIEACGADFQEVRTESELQQCDGLILPGGESSTMLKLIDIKNLWNPIKKFLAEKPSWGICAGAILLAESVTSHEQKSFGKMPVSICRNGYGRQLHSHEETVLNYQVSWIRAPKIHKFHSSLTVRHKNQMGDPVWLESQDCMLTTFHPELNLDAPSPWHQSFIEKANASQSLMCDRISLKD